MLILTTNYNNYYNRLHKPLVKSVRVTQTISTFYINSFDNINFVPNDGIRTEQIMNCSLEDIGNYWLLSEDKENISSRWFVIEATRQRNGQYKVILQRDLISDFYEEIVNAPAFIEKAKVNASDPAIFNKEGMQFNQIKTSETPLKDETGCAWIVGYIPRNDSAATGKITSSFVADTETDIATPLEEWEFGRYIDNANAVKKANDIRMAVYVMQGTYGIKLPYNVKRLVAENVESAPNNGSSLQSVEIPNLFNNLNENFRSSFINVNNSYNNYLDDTTFLTMLLTNGKTIKDNAGNIYRINLIVESEETEEITPAVNSNLYNLIDTSINKAGLTSKIANDKSYKVFNTVAKCYFTLEQVTSNISTDMLANRFHLEDSPYDMFAIPYSDDLIINKNGTRYCKSNKSAAMAIATAILEKYSGTTADLQLLPYCPVRYCLLDDGTFDISNRPVQAVYDDEGTIYNVVLWALRSQFTFDIEYSIPVTDYKVSNECDMYRLTSPNYNGIFEFSPAMNGGVTRFNVDCTYKPYNPYIHINPDFGLMYGQDFNDARGLICGGDFSLPRVNSAWASYELQNKNYQLQFDRNIQSLELRQGIQKTEAIIGALSGSVMAGMSGFASTGNAGAGLAMGATSAVGGVWDVVNQYRLMADQKSLMIDQYNYNLQNIQAIPENLVKVSAYNANNKIFPFVEYYTCTDVEKEAFRNKLKYEGYTVMRIGTIKSFLQTEFMAETYIKARIIRFDDLKEDYHVANEINNILEGGVYFQ